GAGALHLHVRVDGEVRRRLRGAYRHPCRRRRAGQPAQRSRAQMGGAVRPVLRRAVHRRRRHDGLEVRARAGADRSGLGRPRAAALDRVFLRPRRLLPDVLPLSPGRLAVLLDRRPAAHRRKPRRRRRGRADRRGEGAMTAAIIFGLLIALMLTGMPISIALGLTVLTFLYTMTQVPIESVALKLFTGIENFEIMAIPFFILAGNFLTHGGVARRMIAFATSMIGHWYGGLGLAGVMACALF